MNYLNFGTFYYIATGLKVILYIMGYYCLVDGLALILCPVSWLAIFLVLAPVSVAVRNSVLFLATRVAIDD